MAWQGNPGQGGYYPGGGPQGGYPGGPQPGYPGGPQGGYPGSGQGYPGGGYPDPGPGNIGFSVPPYGGGAPPGGPPQSGMYGSNLGNVEADIKGFQFDDASIRQGFIRKVYSILMLQLLITLGMIAAVSLHEGTREYVRHSQGLFWGAFATTIVTMLIMACCGDVRRQAPMNFIFLLIFTVAEGFLLSVIASYSNPQAVMAAVGITAAICLALTLFSFQTKYDFTGAGTYLFVAVLVFLLFGIIASIFHLSGMHLIYSFIGALLFSAYLVYDTQLMLGGKHKYSVSPEEYIFAALNIYMDIVNIFIYILSIINSSDD